MNRREAVRRLVELEDKGKPTSLAEVSAQLAMHCETNPHEYVTTWLRSYEDISNRCAWCGKKRDE